MTSQFRKQFLFQLALNRAELLQALAGLTTEQLEQPLWEDYSSRRILPHIALWEGFEADRLQLFIEGRLDEVHWIPVDERNAAWHLQSADIGVDGGIAMLQKERNGLLNVLANAPDELLKSTVKLGDIDLPVMNAVNNSIEHDEEHARDIQAWREANAVDPRLVGPRSVLVAYLRATRKAVRTLYDLIAGADVEIDGWTPKEILAHLAGWEQILFETLESNVLPSGDVDETNQHSVDKLAAKSVDKLLKLWINSRQTVIDAVEKMSDARLSGGFDNRPDYAVYRMVRLAPDHDLEHVRELYAAWLIKKRTKKAK